MSTISQTENGSYLNHCLFSLQRRMASRTGGYNLATTLGDPPKHLVCLICCLITREPHQASCCGKLFCQSCLERWQLNSHTCPHCKQDITARHFKDTRATQEVGDLTVYCPNREACEWSGELRAVFRHLSSCPKQVPELSDDDGYSVEEARLRSVSVCSSSMEECNQCGESIQREWLDEHLHHYCSERWHQCPHCHVTGSYSHMTTEHLNDCNNLTLPCPNEGCREMISINKTEEHLCVCEWSRRDTRINTSDDNLYQSSIY